MRTNHTSHTSHTARRSNFPAFPFPGFLGGGGLPAQPSNSGMSYRDYLAAKVLEKLMEHGEDHPVALAKQSFDIADAMINERDCRA